jgi:hypothetical protein
MIVGQIAMLLMVAALGYQTPRLTAAMPIVDQHHTIIGNTVLATADVDKSGIIRNVRVLQRVTPFTEKAADAISKWKFDPGRFNGHPVDSEISMIFMFRPPSFSNFGVGGPTLGFTRPEIPGGDQKHKSAICCFLTKFFTDFFDRGLGPFPALRGCCKMSRFRLKNEN